MAHATDDIIDEVVNVHEDDLTNALASSVILWGWAYIPPSSTGIQLTKRIPFLFVTPFFCGIGWQWFRANETCVIEVTKYAFHVLQQHEIIAVQKFGIRNENTQPRRQYNQY